MSRALNRFELFIKLDSSFYYLTPQAVSSLILVTKIVLIVAGHQKSSWRPRSLQLCRSWGTCGTSLQRRASTRQTSPSGGGASWACREEGEGGSPKEDSQDDLLERY